MAHKQKYGSPGDEAYDDEMRHLGAVLGQDQQDTMRAYAVGHRARLMATQAEELSTRVGWFLQCQFYSCTDSHFYLPGH